MTDGCNSNCIKLFKIITFIQTLYKNIMIQEDNLLSLDAFFQMKL
jgi:hypothetical protein